MELRFVVEDNWDEVGSEVYYRPKRILQQKWETEEEDGITFTEWRNVEEVKE